MLQPNMKPHLLVRSAKYKKLRRQLAAKERAKATRAKQEQLRLRREEDEISQAPGSRDAAVCAWLAELGLEQYYPKIRTFGAVSAEELKAISPAELDGMGMRKLEKARFLKAIEEMSKVSAEKISVRVHTSIAQQLAAAAPMSCCLPAFCRCSLCAPSGVAYPRLIVLWGGLHR
jgi:hypothetical protein